jgi:hypothetical protein
VSTTVHRLPGEAIVIATLRGNVDVATMQAVFQQTHECIGADEQIFRITDVREADSTFAEIMAIIQSISKATPGSTTDPRIRAVFVGNNHWVQMVRTAMHLKQFGAINIPMFLTIEDAIDYIHLEQQKTE